MGREPALANPYGVWREGQYEMAKAVFDAITNRRDLILSAPSGSGKTLAVLSGVLEAINVSERKPLVVYVVRTWRQIKRVVEDLSHFLSKTGYQVKTSVLIPLDKGCFKYQEYGYSGHDPLLLKLFCSEQITHDKCEYWLKLQTPNQAPLFNVDPEIVVKGYKDLGVCGYYASKLASVNSDLVLCTYQGVLLVNEYFPGRLSPEVRTDSVLVVDEAHNLIDLLVNEQTTVLRTGEVKVALDLALRTNNIDLATTYLSLISVMREIATSSPDKLELDKRVVLESMERLSRTMDKLALARPLQSSAYILRVSLKLLRLLEYLSSGDNSGLKLSVEDDTFILTPSNIKRLLTKARFLNKNLYSSIILVSATFLKPSVYSKILETRGSKPLVVNITNDPLRRLCVTIIDVRLTSRYSRRGRDLYKGYAKAVLSLYDITGGPMVFYTTSYDILKNVSKELADLVREKEDNTPIVLEERPNMSLHDAERLSDTLISTGGVLLAVYGGRFDEGEDFASGSLKGVVLGGLPIPPPTRVRKELIASCEKSGFSRGLCRDLFVITPAVRKIIQAAGRVFRRKGQRGVVLVLERRVLGRIVYSKLPQWLKSNVILSSVLPPDEGAYALPARSLKIG